MKTRLLRAPGPACEQWAIDKAATTEGVQVLVVGCEHNLVGLTLVVDGGLIVNWTIWPAANVEIFARGAVQQVDAIRPLLESQPPSDRGVVN